MPDHLSTIIFIHGNLTDANIFPIKKLRTHIKDAILLFPELPGHGKALRQKQYTLSSLKQYLSEYINSIRSSNIYIIAHSFSGHLLLQSLSMLSHQEKIHSISLWGTPPIANPNTLNHYFNQEYSRFLFSDNDNKNELLTVLSDCFYPLSKEYIQKCIRNTDPLFRKDLKNPIFYEKYQNEINLLEHTQIPVQLNFGTKDTLVNQHYLNELETHNRFKVNILPGKRHFPFREDEKEFIQIIKGILYHNTPSL